jgi:DNA-directed RNA polymerase specialized sigma24 family protein
MTPPRPTVPFAAVDRADALDSLPEAYATALRLRDAGSELVEIAWRLRIAPEAVAGALEFAEAKLARLLATDARETP